MKSTIFLMIVISTGMVLAAKEKKLLVVNPEFRHRLPYNPKKINQKGVYQRYTGYSIIAKIDGMAEVAKEVEKYIRSSSLGKSYAPLPFSSYHTTIYLIGNRAKMGPKLLEERNKKAMCFLQSEQNVPLHIKYASLDIGKTTISLTLQLRQDSLELIDVARQSLAKNYGNKFKPLKKFHITLAYVYKKVKAVDVEVWNRLNRLVRSFNGAKLMPASVYGFKSMKEYYRFQRKC